MAFAVTCDYIVASCCPDNIDASLLRTKNEINERSSRGLANSESSWCFLESSATFNRARDIAPASDDSREKEKKKKEKKREKKKKKKGNGVARTVHRLKSLVFNGDRHNDRRKVARGREERRERERQ